MRIRTRCRHRPHRSILLPEAEGKRQRFLLRWNRGRHSNRLASDWHADRTVRHLRAVRRFPTGCVQLPARAAFHRLRISAASNQQTSYLLVARSWKEFGLVSVRSRWRFAERVHWLAFQSVALREFRSKVSLILCCTVFLFCSRHPSKIVGHASGWICRVATNRSACWLRCHKWLPLWFDCCNESDSDISSLPVGISFKGISLKFSCPFWLFSLLGSSRKF